MTPEASMSEALRAEAEPLWEKIHEHPFVRGIGDGTLPMEQFRFYMRQDYVFLKEYSRAIALAVVKAPGLEEMGRFADLLNATLNTEMVLHRSFAGKFGVSAEEIEATRPAPPPAGAMRIFCWRRPSPAPSGKSPPPCCPASGTTPSSGSGSPSGEFPKTRRFTPNG